MVKKVVKLAQPGYDVKIAGDENLIYSSEWPTLRIYKQGSFTAPDASKPTYLVTEHDLGYPPVYWYTANTGVADWLGENFTVDDNRAEFSWTLSGLSTPAVTDKKMVIDFDAPPDPDLGSGTYKFYYYIFDLDMTKPFRAPVTRIGAQPTGRASDKVFKISKPDKDLDSTNMEDFIIHSNARTPLVHAVVQDVTKADGSLYGFGFTYYHNLGYTPMYLAYYQLNDSTTPNTWLLAQSTNQFLVDNEKIRISDGVGGRPYNLVILKDPFHIEYAVDVRV